MSAELWLVRPCKHAGHIQGALSGWCKEASRVRLDPEQVVRLINLVAVNESLSIGSATVADIIAALDQEETL